MEDVLDQLATLTPDKLREAQARLHFLLGRESAPATPAGKASEDQELAFDALREAMVGAGLYFPKGLGALRRHYKWPKFVEAVDTVSAFVTEHVKPESRLERVAAWRFLTGLLVRHRRRLCRDHAKARPLEFETLVDLDLPKVGDVVERNFPGYLAAGLVRAMVTRRIPKRPKLRVRRTASVRSA